LSKAKSFEISKHVVFEAWKQIRAIRNVAATEQNIGQVGNEEIQKVERS